MLELLAACWSCLALSATSLTRPGRDQRAAFSLTRSSFARTGQTSNGKHLLRMEKQVWLVERRPHA